MQTPKVETSVLSDDVASVYTDNTKIMLVDAAEIPGLITKLRQWHRDWFEIADADLQAKKA